ncbi:MAG TPA: hypothetical protein VIY72_08770, partial [Acidimicrobiales bacterium]
MSDATGFITSQRNNRRASLVILAGTFLLLFVVVNALVFVVGGFTSQDCEPVRSPGFGAAQETCTRNFQFQPVVIGIVAVLVVGYLVFAWLASGRAALTMVHARPAEGPEFAELRSLVEQMAIASGLPMPKV